MARSVILISLFTAGVYAARVENKNAEHGSQAWAPVGHPRIVLGPSLPSTGMPSVPTVAQSVQVGNAPQITAWRRQALSNSRSALVSMQDPGYDPDLPDDWGVIPGKVMDYYETDVNPGVPMSTGLVSALSTGLMVALRQQGRPVAGTTCTGMLNFRSAPRATLAMQAGSNKWKQAGWGDGPGQSFEVEFTIMPDGRMTYKIKGIKGDGCVPVSESIKQMLEEEMGCEVYEETATEEMFEQPVNVEVSEYESQEVKDNNGSSSNW